VLKKISNKKYFNVLIMIFFLAFGLLIYGSSLNNPFVMDDDMQIVQNVHIRSLDNLSSFFTSSSFDDGTGKMVGIYYKPLMTTYYAIAWNVLGNKPIDFRLPLMLIHITSSFLIFLFSLHFLPIKYSMILGLVFLIHPINTEVALYIADAQDIFYFFFGILSLYCIEVIKNKKILFLSLILLFTAGLFSKETGALFLLIGGAYTFFIHPQKKIPVFTSIVIIAVSYLILRWQIGMVHVRGEQIVFQTASFWERLRMLPLILGHYVEIFFFPMRLSVATDFILQEFSFKLF
jgi:4-amino-4-deoxy-L-arabinose transferase-like glycosyltransferase